MFLFRWMATSISKSPEETESLGELWGREARPGWVFALTGDLGAGKTQLVRGLARGLDSPARVHSPTFVLLTTYEGGRYPLHHLDLYRLSGADEVNAEAEYDTRSEYLVDCAARGADRGIDGRL